ncbi:HD domain-containing phosphohydrolase [Vibrio sp. HN007]|uniref:HD domain-containing phosphohydrolase n=1 Tax=Vibrio iocasae TaxID=3098914 RepID=UPI0035D4FF8B
MMNIKNNQAIQPLKDMMRLAWQVEERDPYTSGHLWRVSKFANITAEHLNWTAIDVSMVTLGAFLHDIGKMEVSVDILNKPGPLTEAEFNEVKKHPAIGYHLIEENPFSHLVLDSIYHHHERADGNGYPNRLVSVQVSKHAKLVSICDAFDAMTSQRSYRAPLSKEMALEEIRQNLGTQFDLELGETFICLGEKGEFDNIILHTDDGIPLQHCPMCGPTIEVFRHQTQGDSATCKVCSSQYTISTPIQKQHAQWLSSDAITDFINATISKLPSSAFTRNGSIEHGELTFSLANDANG